MDFRYRNRNVTFILLRIKLFISISPVRKSNIKTYLIVINVCHLKTTLMFLNINIYLRYVCKYKLCHKVLFLRITKTFTVSTLLLYTHYLVRTKNKLQKNNVYCKIYLYFNINFNKMYFYDYT